MKVLFVCSGNVKNFEIVPFIKEQGDSLKQQGIDVDYYPIVGKGLSGYLKAGLKLKKYLAKNRYDVIHAHYTLSGWAAIIGAGKLPVVLSLMGTDANGAYVGVKKVALKSRISTFLTWSIQPFVKAIISKSANIEKHVYLKHKSYIVPNGINLEKFKPANTESITVDGLKNGKRKVLFLGDKNKIGKNYPLAQAAVTQLGLTNVELVSPYPLSHSEVPAYLNTADVLVLPSLMEGSPNVIKEAMACNCPIVSADTGDVRWVLGETDGCYLASYDVNDFSRKIKDALDFSKNKGRTNGMQRIIELGLDSETIARRIAAIYKKILQIPA